jgi:hypothetical protein
MPQTHATNNSLALKMWEQLQARKQQKGREGDAVEDAHDRDEREHGVGKEGRVLLSSPV